MTQNQVRFVELEKFRKAFLEDFDAALKAVSDELGIDNYFQDEEGVVYKIITPAGKWVKFDAVSYVRTKRNGEEKGTLSVKEAKEAGYAA